MNRKEMLIDVNDTKNKIHNLPIFLRKIFLKKYIIQGIIYIENNKPTYCSDIVRWLDIIKITTTSRKRADKIAFEYFQKKYPQYKNYVQIF